MASSTVTAISLHCNLCSNPFSDPRLLPCLHIFCKSCLDTQQSVQNGGILTCPSCYKTTTRQPSQLPIHLRIEKEVELSKLKQSGEAVCDICDDNNKADSYCEECVSPICSDCVSSHQRIKLFKGHNIVSLDSAKPQTPPATCGLHPKSIIKYYCFKCRSLVCSECLIDHKLHKWVSIDEAAEIEKGDLKLFLPKVEERCLPINEVVVKIDSVIKIVDKNKGLLAEELDKAVKEIISAVERRHTDLLKELDDLTIAKKTQLEMQKEDIERIQSGLKRVLDTGTCACDEYSSLEVLAIKGFIQHASEELLEECRLSSLHPVAFEGPRLQIDLSTVNEAVSSFGKIIPMSHYPPLCSLVDINPKLPIGVAVKCECLLTLQARNNRGEDLMEGGANVKGIYSNKRFKNSPLANRNCDVRDLCNGKYEIGFLWHLPGIFELHITVDDIPVQDSPYWIKFIDYGSMFALESCSNFINILSPNYICCDNHIRLFVSTNEGSIEIYDDNGNKVKEIPKSKHDGKHLRGIAVDDKNAVMFISSSGTHKIIKTDLNGKVIATIGRGKGSGEMQFKFPTGLCLTKEGLLLVGDCNNERVQVLGSDMSFVRFIECDNPVWGVSVDTAGNVHIGTTDCVEVFTINGVKVTEYGQRRLYKAGDIQFPNFQHPTKSTYSLVTHCIDVGEVCLYNWSKDELLHSFNVGDHPLGLTIDQQGTLYVCCYETNLIILFS